jgi:HEAT repeat protein
MHVVVQRRGHSAAMHRASQRKRQWLDRGHSLSRSETRRDAEGAPGMLCAPLPVQLQPMTPRHRPTAFASELRRIVADLEGDRRALVDADVRTLDSAGVRSVDDLFESLRRTDDADLPIIACWFVPRIRGIPKATAVRQLVCLLADPSARVRHSAAIALGELGSRSATSRLLKAIGDEDAEVRMAVVYALGKLGDVRARESRLHVLGDLDEKPKIRAAAAESLGSLGDRESGPALVACLRDRSPEVRLFCAFALGELREPRALRALQRMVRTDKGRVRTYGTVGRAARSAIEAIRGARA